MDLCECDPESVGRNDGVLGELEVGEDSTESAEYTDERPCPCILTAMATVRVRVVQRNESLTEGSYLPEGLYDYIQKTMVEPCNIVQPLEIRIVRVPATRTFAQVAAIAVVAIPTLHGRLSTHRGQTKCMDLFWGHEIFFFSLEPEPFKDDFFWIIQRKNFILSSR